MILVLFQNTFVNIAFTVKSSSYITKEITKCQGANLNSPYLLVYEFLQFVDIFWKYKEHEIFIEK